MTTKFVGLKNAKKRATPGVRAGYVFAKEVKAGDVVTLPNGHTVCLSKVTKLNNLVHLTGETEDDRRKFIVCNETEALKRSEIWE